MDGTVALDGESERGTKIYEEPSDGKAETCVFGIK